MVGIRKGNQIQLCSSYPPELVQELDRLIERTRVPMATYMREAVEDLIAKYNGGPKESGGRSKQGSI